MIDLAPAARRLAAVVDEIADDQLDAPTPCEKYRLSGLLGHALGLSVAFRQAAEKDPAASDNPPGAEPPSTAELPADWRDRLKQRLEDLVAAWRDPAAWEGDTEAGGVTMPAPAMATVALQELVIHGWDIARASGQDFAVDPVSLQVLYEQLADSVPDEGTPGLFGPPIRLPEESPLQDRVIGLTGRDPAWRP